MNLYIIKYLLFFLLFPTLLLSQEKYDHIWLISANVNDPMTLTWKNKDAPDTATIKVRSQIVIQDPNASICDRNGNFLFYSSGCAIAGRNYKMLPNGSINPGLVHHNYCFDDSTNPYPAFNNIVFLPKPNDTSRYFLFHTARADTSIPHVALPFQRFYYTEMDVNKGTVGGVVKKNVFLSGDILSEIGPTACKHSNGQDWWVIVPSLLTHSYHRALLTENGAFYIGKQGISKNFGYTKDDWAGQAVFSPDGTKYVRSDPFNGTYIFDFDRCTGLMSKPIFIDTLGRYSCSGVSISPNSRYLYIANRDILHQFDLQATNIPQSKIEIAKRDSFVTTIGLDISFYKSMLAPNGKIYIGSTNGADWLCVIHQPDEKGKACNFKQHDFKLPKNYFVGLPNFPHFRMKKQEGVVCQPIIATEDKKEESILHIYPNPTNGLLHIDMRIEVSKTMTWDLFDTQGKQVFSTPLQGGQTALELPTFLPQGIYFWRVTDGVKLLQSGKLVIVE